MRWIGAVALTGLVSASTAFATTPASTSPRDLPYTELTQGATAVPNGEPGTRIFFAPTRRATAAFAPCLTRRDRATVVRVNYQRYAVLALFVRLEGFETFRLERVQRSRDFNGTYVRVLYELLPRSGVADAPARDLYRVVRIPRKSLGRPLPYRTIAVEINPHIDQRLPHGNCAGVSR